MTKEDYVNELKKLRTQYDEQVKLLGMKYASENNTNRIGDVVTDHIGSIRIESIGYCDLGANGYNRFPSVIYNGVQLKKDGSPKARGNKRTVFQINLIK